MEGGSIRRGMTGRGATHGRHPVVFHRLVLGPVLTLLVLLAIETSNRWFFTIPNPAVIYFTAVVFAAFQDRKSTRLNSSHT